MSATQHPVIEHLMQRFPGDIVSASDFRGDLSVTVRKEALLPIGRHLKEALQFDYIVHVASADYPTERERFEVIYEVYSIRRRQRLRLKTRVSEADGAVDSLCGIWYGANFMEREVYDMMGIRFHGHPDLRRILLPDEYEEGFPLRKDFPLQGKGWRDTFDDFMTQPAPERTS
ncbi:MAG: NADH-quinone oxidoreductase subunit C [Nitrospirota bacterium]